MRRCPHQRSCARPVQIACSGSRASFHQLGVSRDEPDSGWFPDIERYLAIAIIPQTVSDFCSVPGFRHHSLVAHLKSKCSRVPVGGDADADQPDSRPDDGSIILSRVGLGLRLSIRGPATVRNSKLSSTLAFRACPAGVGSEAPLMRSGSRGQYENTVHTNKT